MKPFKWLNILIPKTLYAKYRRLRLSLKNGFDHERFSPVYSSFDKSFLDKYLQDNLNFYTSINNLKSNLDQQSIDILDSNTQKIKDFILKFPALNVLYPCAYYKKHFINEDQLSSEEIAKNQQLQQQYKVPANLPIEYYLFETDYGMNFLDSRVTTKLKGKDVIDCGSNWGDSAIIMSKYSPKHIYAYEPINDTYATLKQIIKENNLTDVVIPKKQATGKENGQITIYTERANKCFLGTLVKSNSDTIDEDNTAIYPESIYERQDIEIITIDDAAKENNLEVGLIKMDIEGAEQDALQGALEVIKRDKPILLISIYHNFEDYSQIKPFLENLNLGYKFMVRKLCPNRSILDTILIAYTEPAEQE